MSKSFKQHPIRFESSLFILTIIIFVWSFINCEDLTTWFLEAFPVIIGFSVLFYTFKTFRLSRLTYLLITIHAIILLVGAHYTYAKEPVFNWIRDTFELNRNNYDRLGHLAQGFIPAIITREVLIRKSVVNGNAWRFFLTICFCLAFSAAFELFEWAVAISSEDNAIEYLAMQGDQWDTQKDMLLCLFGAITSLLTLSKLHDKSMAKLNNFENV